MKLVQKKYYIEKIRFYFCKVKGHPKTCLCRNRGEAEIKPKPTCNLAIEGGGGQHHALTSLTQYPVPIYMTLGGPRGSAWTATKISPSPGSDLLTAMSAASRYTD
jgi:hypothetical protein